MKLILSYCVLIALILLCTNCMDSKKISTNKTGAASQLPLRGTYWKLTELMGQPIPFSSGNGREAHIKFNADGKTVGGNGGCNTFSTVYQSIDSTHFTFGPVMSTKMYCNEAKFENLFFDVLSKTDNFLIHGDTLFLRNAGMDSTAKFIANPLKK